MSTSEGSSSLAADKIVGHEDLLTEILVRLPPHSVLRCQCVCKHWQSLISHPQFRRLYSRWNHSHRTSFPNVLSVRGSGPSGDQFDFIYLNDQTQQTDIMISRNFINFVDSFSHVGSVVSCNGLFLVKLAVHSPSTYYIFNPTTNQSKKLPPLYISGQDGPGGPDETVNLVFDPLKSPHYKVICYWTELDDDWDLDTHYLIHLAVYASETGVWKESGQVLEEENIHRSIELIEGVYWNGAIHWADYDDPFACLDVDSLCFKTMPSTPIPEGQFSRKIMYFGESGDYLHLTDLNGVMLNVLRMEKDYSKWILKYRVDLDRLFVSSLSNLEFGSFEVLCLLHDEKEDKSRLLLCLPPDGLVFSYDLTNLTMKRLLVTIPRREVPSLTFQFDYPEEIHQFVGTLSYI